MKTSKLPAVLALIAFSVLAMVTGCGRRISEDSSESEKGIAAAATTPPASSPTPAPTGAPKAAKAANAAASASGEGWNAAQIDWKSYDEGMRLAKAQNKPVLLVFFTTWCPHCKNYSHVFEDPRVVERARDFVMIHLDADAEEAVASKYARDGSYIPRTFFLSPDGTLDETIHAPRPQSIYFYDEHNPLPLLASMETARKKLVN
jgi:thiol-disulfide isomerase/thioredoxin